MRLIICEFLWQIEALPDLQKNDLLFALNPVVDYELERRGISYLTVKDVYCHEELWLRYKEYTDTSLQLATRLDEILWKTDPRFRAEEFKVFDYLYYVLKISYDQIHYYLMILDRLLQKHEVKTIFCCKPSKPEYDESGLYGSNFSVVSHLLPQMRCKYSFNIEYILPPEGAINEPFHSTTFSFGQPRFDVALKNRLIPFYRWLKKFRMKLRRNKPPKDGKYLQVLSIDCNEVEKLNEQYGIPGVEISTYSSKFPLVDRNRDFSHTEIIQQKIKEDEIIKELLVFQKIDLLYFFLATIVNYLNNLDKFLDEYQKFKKIFTGKKFDIVFFRSLAPLNPVNIIALHYCNKMDLPCVCWMHGGYGANFSLPGYDVVDYRLGKYHFVYGEVISNLLKNQRCVNNLLGPYEVKSYAVGTPYLEYIYENYRRPANARKRIMLTIGNMFKYNEFYFGSNREYAEYCNYEEHRAIIETLIPFQEYYDIVIKDYPAINMKHTWESILRDNGGDNITVITNEMSYQNALQKADVNILTWVSTSFVESLFTDADILLLDISRDVSEESKKLFSENIIFDTDIDSFKIKLSEYLKAGKFYSQNKEAIRKAYTGSGNKRNMQRKVKEAILDILTDTKNN